MQKGLASLSQEKFTRILQFTKNNVDKLTEQERLWSPFGLNTAQVLVSLYKTEKRQNPQTHTCGIYTCYIKIATLPKLMYSISVQPIKISALSYKTGRADPKSSHRSTQTQNTPSHLKIRLLRPDVQTEVPKENASRSMQVIMLTEISQPQITCS